MDREQPDQYVHRCQREGRNDCRRSWANTVRLERWRVPDDPGTIRKRDSPHRWYHHHLCFVLRADFYDHREKQPSRRCMLIARTFKSSLLQRWSAHLWQNGMTQAPV